jgi:ADP-heptose:LPS heptosyltransferase
MKAFRYTTGETGPTLFILTGSKCNVFRKTGLMKEIYNTQQDKIIVTNQNNLDIFYNLPNTKIYPMNPETFLILKNKYYNSIISSPETELSIAFSNELHQRGAISVNKEFIDIDGWSYHFMPTSHPIDLIHNRIKRKGSYLIGINIGEDEHLTKKIPYSFVCDLMKKLMSKINVKFVFFGTIDSILRAEMIKRETGIEVISMIGNYTTQMFAQAISMCDCFISLNRFLLHLSISVKQDTIGMFYRDEFKNKKDENDIINLYPFTIKSECENCNEFRECELIYRHDKYCLDNFRINDISSMASLILESKDIK